MTALAAADLTRHAGSARLSVWRTRWRIEVIPAAVALAALVLYLTVGLLRYLTYHAGYDLGYFAQVVDRTASGHPFETSFAPYSFLGQHWEPALLLPALVTRVIATPVLLIGLQSIALAAAPVGAWRLARVWIGGRLAPAAACLATALSPLAAAGAVSDFHTEAVTPALALFALDGAARGRRWAFLVPAAALFLVKEDAMLVAAGVGWIAWRANGRRLGIVLAVAGIAGFAITAGVIMPALRGGRPPTELAARYAYLGLTPAAVAHGAVLHPTAVLAHLTGGYSRWGWLRAFGPLVFLPLLAGTALLGVLPALLVALLSDSQWQASLDFQYGLEVLPLLLACALLGWRRVAPRRGGRAPAVCAGALVTAALVAYLASGYLPGGHGFDVARVTGLERRGAVEAVLRLVPQDASVSASTGLLAHLANRAAIYQFPDGMGARCVVLDGDASAGAVLPTEGYHLVTSAGGVTLWER